jgi:Uma2 family endonuclease
MAMQESLEAELKTWRWTKDQYYRMAEMGWFEGKRVELIEGEIVEMSPIGSRHWICVGLAADALHRIFPHSYIVATQNPLNLGSGSEPIPDVAVITGAWRDYKDSIPTTAVLVVEVADTTLKTDRIRKAALYARAGIPEYWIVNLVRNQLEVQRHPEPGLGPSSRFGYRDVVVLTANDTVAPMAAPHAAIAVSELLP